MLRLLTGLAGTGKTAFIYNEIKTAVENKQGGRYLIVPEQFSHEAERELCLTCGPALSLYAEVLSFTGLARLVRKNCGGTAAPVLDKGGKFLSMAMAIKSCEGALTVFRRAVRRPEMHSALLSTVDMMKASCVTSDMLFAAAEECSGELQGKLNDLAVISEAYEAVIGNSGADPSDSLSKLAETIGAEEDGTDGTRGPLFTQDTCIYIDGFTDFTRAELEVLRALLKRHVNLTVCFTLDSLGGGSEIFSIQRSGALELLKLAEELGEKTEIPGQGAAGDKDRTVPADPLRFFADNIFTYTSETMDPGGAIELYTTASPTEECSLAASKVLELIREKGARRRDISIAVRGYDEYAPILENTFAEFGIPLFTSRRTPIASRSLPQLISCAWEIINRGWQAEDVLSYTGTGLTGLTEEERDTLDEYICRWEPSAALWHSDNDWHQHPEGYGVEYTGETEEQLREINRIRRALARPLLEFGKKCGAATDCADFAAALYELLETLEVPARLQAKADALTAEGKKTEAAECRQIWDTVVNALEQTYAILGGIKLPADEFAALFSAALAQYDVGIIPVSADEVSAGDFDRMRRRHIKYLIVLGASYSRIPAVPAGGRIFTDDELIRLDELGACMGGKPENELWREYSLIYSCMSLPEKGLTISRPLKDAEGSETGPSIIVDRAKKLFNIEEKPYNSAAGALNAPLPALRLALSGRDTCPEARLAEAYFEKTGPELLRRAEEAAAMTRGRLSPAASAVLYGREPKITASKAEQFASCKYRFFSTYGLKLRPFGKAEFSASAMGTFTHYVLENTARAAKERGGFKAVSDSFIEEQVRLYTEKYEAEELKGLGEKSGRFIYLLHRAGKDLLKITMDMAAELRKSEFEPAEFEFDISRIGPKGMRGFIDRLDLFRDGDTAWVRIFDYKTGNKKFSMSDIWYGMSMQLMMYLYTVCTAGDKAVSALELPEGTVLRPAGAVYVPASNRYVSTDPEPDDGTVESRHLSDCKRSGIILGSRGIPEAWETGGSAVYSPVKLNKDGEVTGDAAVTEEQLDMLHRHMLRRLDAMTEQLKSGAIEADPYIKGGNTADTPCAYCDMKGCCGFEDGERGEARRILTAYKADEVWQMIAEEEKASGRGSTDNTGEEAEGNG